MARWQKPDSPGWAALRRTRATIFAVHGVKTQGIRLARGAPRVPALQREHLAHYLHEFAFRYSGRAKAGISDMERSTRAIQGI
jgi:hypothetical protein